MVYILGISVLFESINTNASNSHVLQCLAGAGTEFWGVGYLLGINTCGREGEQVRVGTRCRPNKASANLMENFGADMACQSCPTVCQHDRRGLNFPLRSVIGCGLSRECCALWQGDSLQLEKT